MHVIDHGVVDRAVHVGQVVRRLLIDGDAEGTDAGALGLEIAGYVSCQTNRPFGIEGESFENPKYPDKFVETMCAAPIDEYDERVSCCGGGLAFSETEKAQALIKDIMESAYDGGAEMIIMLCPVCRMNVEIYQHLINAKYKTKFKMPVVYYSALMSVAYGKTVEEAGLDGQIIRAKQLEDIAAK